MYIVVEPSLACYNNEALGETARLHVSSEGHNPGSRIMMFESYLPLGK